jgi:hypothetical protein
MARPLPGADVRGLSYMRLSRESEAFSVEPIQTDARPFLLSRSLLFRQVPGYIDHRDALVALEQE